MNIPKSLSMIATVAKSSPETGSAFAVLSVIVKENCSFPSTTSSSIIPTEKLCVLPASDPAGNTSSREVSDWKSDDAVIK